MNRYFLPVNIVKRVLWDVPWTYLIRIEFSFMDKMKCIPSNERYGELLSRDTVHYAVQDVFNFLLSAWIKHLVSEHAINVGFLLSILPKKKFQENLSNLCVGTINAKSCVLSFFH